MSTVILKCNPSVAEYTMRDFQKAFGQSQPKPIYNIFKKRYASPQAGRTLIDDLLRLQVPFSIDFLPSFL